jgi:DNA-directed RNA polymerase subunit E"
MREMPSKQYACSECNLILPDPEDKKEIPQCPYSPTAPVSNDWQGLVIIMNPETSEVGKRMGVTRPGSYALKVNVR